MTFAAKRRKQKKRRFHAPLILLLLFFACLGILRYVVLTEYLYPREYQDLVRTNALAYGLSENLVYAVIKTESNFDPAANSHKDAKGLMQVLDATGSWAAENLGLADYQDEDLYDPAVNIQIGCWYLARLVKQFGSVELALVAYNAGEGNLTRWLADTAYSADGETLDVIPYSDTEKYLESVLRREKIYNYLYK